jgi:DNA-binding HxlR family transcriptional regulator
MPTGNRQPLAEAAERVGDRWSLLVVEALLEGPRRFTDLQAEIGIASNVLSQRLKHLEREGVLVARPYSRRPPRVDYELTSSGHDLAGALRLLADWGAQSSGRAARHVVCGTPLEPRWYCPTCATPVEDGGGTELHRI